MGGWGALAQVMKCMNQRWLEPGLSGRLAMQMTQLGFLALTVGQHPTPLGTGGHFGKSNSCLPGKGVPPLLQVSGSPRVGVSQLGPLGLEASHPTSPPAPALNLNNCPRKCMAGASWTQNSPLKRKSGRHGSLGGWTETTELWAGGLGYVLVPPLPDLVLLPGSEVPQVLSRAQKHFLVESPWWF